MYGTFRLFHAIPRHPRNGGGSRRQTAAGPPFLGDWFRCVCSCRHSYRETRNLTSQGVYRSPEYHGYILAAVRFYLIFLCYIAEDTWRRELKGRLMGRVNKSQANAVTVADTSNFEKKSKGLSLLDVFYIKFLRIFLEGNPDRRLRNEKAWNKN